VDLSGLSAIKKVRVLSIYGTNYVSEMICSTASTVRLRGYTRYPIGAGSDTAWTGTYADVDETVYSDVDGLESGTATQIETVTGSTTTLGGFAVEAVLVGARAALGNDGANQGRAGHQLALRQHQPLLLRRDADRRLFGRRGHLGDRPGHLGRLDRHQRLDQQLRRQVHRMSNPVVTKLTEMIVQGPASAKVAVSKVTEFIIVDTTRSDTATPTAARHRARGYIRYGDGG
jgi:hypothetical protein